jgi:long-subunit acyl-CoA synthetase (AMP-forming)
MFFAFAFKMRLFFFISLFHLPSRENVCIFAETKAEWLMCAIGCFKQTFPLVTLYANLGDEAIAHGINQTEVTHVITTHELLPKFRNVLAKTPTVKYVIFMEDQINDTDITGYKVGLDCGGRIIVQVTVIIRPVIDSPMQCLSNITKEQSGHKIGV